MSRPAVVVALPRDELIAVSAALNEAGMECIAVRQPDELEALLAERHDIEVAILDGEFDFDRTLEFYSVLHDEHRKIPAIMVVSASALERLAAGGGGSIDDEYVTRPYSAESLRWRVEAMCIRAHVVDDGSGPVLQSGSVDMTDWTRRATVVTVFNPKGGVGKTTVATNLAAALQGRHGQKVLLVDADTVTGHVCMSLGLEPVRTVADAWLDQTEGGPSESITELAATHSSGIRVIALTANPLAVEVLEPPRVVAGINAARAGFDFVVIDVHPSYSPLNQALFEISDRILVPVTPDVPALRAAVQLRDVAAELGFRDRLAMVVNRANSGVSVADMERTVGMPALALIRSGGLLFVRAANEGRTVVERYPKEKVTEDFEALADHLMPTPAKTSPAAAPQRAGLPFFGRKEPVRA